VEFEITLTAKTTDDGGLKTSFERQLLELGGNAELISEVAPYRVDSSDGFYFQAERKYKITL
jgi:hypothetical protein